MSALYLSHALLLLSCPPTFVSCNILKLMGRECLSLFSYSSLSWNFKCMTTANIGLKTNDFLCPVDKVLHEDNVKNIFLRFRLEALPSSLKGDWWEIPL